MNASQSVAGNGNTLNQWQGEKLLRCLFHGLIMVKSPPGLSRMMVLALGMLITS